MHVCMLCHFSHVQLFATPWTVAPHPPGFSVHGIFQARKLEWVAISYSMGWDLPNPGVSCDSCIGRQILYQCASWEREIQF